MRKIEMFLLNYLATKKEKYLALVVLCSLKCLHSLQQVINLCLQLLFLICEFRHSAHCCWPAKLIIKPQ